MPVFVNNTEISDDAVHAEMRHHPSPSLNDARREAARALIIRELLLNAAVERDIIQEEELKDLSNNKEVETIETLLDDVIQLPEADQETCIRYYEQHKIKFTDKTNGKLIPFDMVENHIKTYLEDKGHQAAFSAYVDNLMDNAQIVGL